MPSMQTGKIRKIENINSTDNMPWIPKLKKKNSNSINRKKRQEVYQSSLWQRMRLAQLQKEPLCQICLLEDRVTLATEVHHAHSFLEAQDEVEKDQLAYDSNNLISVCDSCHQRCHHKDLKGTKSLEEIKLRLGISPEEDNTNN